MPDAIELGDWIDLDGGLTVTVDNGLGGFSSSDTGMQWDSDITLNGNPWGKMKRLIVVGINSFNKVNGNDTPHVVFQFQNIPVQRRITSAEKGNSGGYPESEMRTYLTENFLDGLISAGVPENVLWGPSRVMSKKPGPETINDLVWLPTEREMFQDGKSVLYTYKYGPFSDQNVETADNQARLEYYTSNESRVKVYKNDANYPEVTQMHDQFGPYGQSYGEASAYGLSMSGYCVVGSYGFTSNVLDGNLTGCVPAFCVK
jgi:hypothetical protein